MVLPQFGQEIARVSIVLDDVNDVVVVGPIAGQILIYNGAEWRNATVSGDVTITAGGDVQIAAGAIVNADISPTAVIDVSKLAAGNAGDYLQTVAGVPTWSEGFELVGSETTEATTTSVADVDLLTVSGLSIPAVTPILIWVNLRKTAGAPNFAQVGLKLNATVVRSAVNWSTATDRAEQGVAIFYIPGRVTNYNQNGFVVTHNNFQGTSTAQNFNAAAPLVAITDISLRAAVDAVAVTMGADEMRIWTLPV
jgi:hypothetical protein